MAKDKGKAKEIATPKKSPKAHGKDAKLAALVRDADVGSSSKEKDAPFDVKKIGKKAVFRPILSSPFNTRWPAVTPVLQDMILHNLLQLLQTDEAQKHFKRENQDVPRTSARKTKDKNKNKRRRARLALEVLKQQGITSNLGTEVSLREPPISESMEDEAESRLKPFLCGINSVTRQMEGSIRSKLDEKAAEELEQDAASTSSIKHNPTIIFVCEADVDPQTLISHFPLLCATYNAVMQQECFLIKLPTDAEIKISEAISLRRCSVLSIDATLLSEESGAGNCLKDLISKFKGTCVKPMKLDWLDNAIESLRGNEVPAIKLKEPRIKHMKSSAILDMNAVKAQKKQARAARKAHRKTKYSLSTQHKGIKRNTHYKK